MAHVHTPGLVLHMYPEELLKHGASHTAQPEDAVSAQHYFVCLSTDARNGLWAPLFQAPGQSFKMIPESSKAGHSRWTRGPSYYDEQQLWSIPHKAAQRGAAAAFDSSLSKSPNTVALSALPNRDVFPNNAAFKPALA
jgi:hypothetical protein